MKKNVKSYQFNSYIQEKRSSLFYHIDKVIKAREGIHITAPVGTGKTSFIISLVKKYCEKYQIVILEPQIAISQQLHTILRKRRKNKKRIEAFIYNSKTYKELDAWEERNGKLWDGAYISTIDSAYKLFKEKRVDPDNTIVVIDEDHTFLQDARVDFDKTVDEIRLAKCPVIGFSATTSSWVVDFVFHMQNRINLYTTSIPKKIVEPYQLSGIPFTIAQVVKNNKYKKVVIFTNNIDDQNRICEAIESENPKSKVVVLNSENRDKDHKKDWKHLIEKESLPQGADVAILNKVIQAGININDTDIDQVIVTGKMDPLGFGQYLGRCRKYTGDYHFLHIDYGKSDSEWKDVQTLEAFLDKTEEYFKVLREESSDSGPIRLLKLAYKDLFKKNHLGEETLNRCVAANLVYNDLRNLHGRELIEFVAKINDSITIKPYAKYQNINPALGNTSNRRKLRNKHRKQLLNLVQENAEYLDKMIIHLNRNWTYKKALDVIDESVTSKSKALSQNKLYLKDNKQKQGLIDTVKTSRKANDNSMIRVLAAAKYYRESGSITTLKTILKTSIKEIKKHIEARAFFENNNYVDNIVLKNILKDLEDLEIDTFYETKQEWYDVIKPYLPKNTIQIVKDELAKMIFNYCFLSKRSRKVVHGEVLNGYKVTEVFYDYNAYRIGNRIADLIK